MDDNVTITRTYNVKPTEQYEKIVKENLIVIKNALLEGVTDFSIATVLGIPPQTYYYLTSKYPEIKAVYEQVELEQTAMVKNALLLKAKGHTVTLTDTDKTGATSSKESYYPPDTTAAIFWLTNRDRQNWQHKTAQEKGGNTYNILSIDKDTTRSDLLAMAARYKELASGADIEADVGPGAGAGAGPGPGPGPEDAEGSDSEE